MIRAKRSDLPLAQDITSRFLPWLIALMVFLSALALGGMMALSGMITRWDKDVSGTLTVQVPPVVGTNSEAATQERVEKIVAYLKGLGGVASAEALSRDKLTALLEPWLGPTGLLQDLPLPRLIDVALQPGITLDPIELQHKLNAIIPGTSVEDHRAWLSRLLRLARTIEVLATGVLILIAVSTSGTVIYATRTGLAVHQPVIEVLHLIGAQDDYIARQFANRAMNLGFKGGIIGLGLAVPAFMAIAAAARRLEGDIMPELWLSYQHWVAIAILPFLAAFIAMLTARVTVHRSLARMT